MTTTVPNQWTRALAGGQPAGIDERTPVRHGRPGPSPASISLVVAFLAASSAPTPLYQRSTRPGLARHRADHHDLAFGVYAFAVLVGLLSLGQLADHLGPGLLLARDGRPGRVDDPLRQPDGRSRR